jgi:hypothetical protein
LGSSLYDGSLRVIALQYHVILIVWSKMSKHKKNQPSRGIKKYAGDLPDIIGSALLLTIIVLIIGYVICSVYKFVSKWGGKRSGRQETQG